MTAAGLLKKVRSIDIQQSLEMAVDQVAPVAEDMNAFQLSEGQYSNGGYLPDYSPVSVELFGKPEGPIRLHDTGAFWKGIKAQAKGMKLSLTSTDPKTEMLAERYGKFIFGLTKENRIDLKKDLQVAFVGDIKLQLR